MRYAVQYRHQYRYVDLRVGSVLDLGPLVSAPNDTDVTPRAQPRLALPLVGQPLSRLARSGSATVRPHVWRRVDEQAGFAKCSLGWRRYSRHAAALGRKQFFTHQGTVARTSWKLFVSSASLRLLLTRDRALTRGSSSGLTTPTYQNRHAQ